MPPPTNTNKLTGCLDSTTPPDTLEAVWEARVAQGELQEDHEQRQCLRRMEGLRSGLLQYKHEMERYVTARDVWEKECTRRTAVELSRIIEEERAAQEKVPITRRHRQNYPPRPS